MKTKKIYDKDKILNALKGLNHIITLDENQKKDLKQFFHIDLDKERGSLRKIGLGAFYLAYDNGNLSFNDFKIYIEIILPVNRKIFNKILNAQINELEKKRFIQFIINYIIDIIKDEIENSIFEGSIKL